eukprot:TRINITY_DN14456_c0_g1_i1.p1 TRINITY_DN14456_c0_g1~~TRINITY_DN14456_c0_g1_i1.p1  ORF type:complete len:261 (-),score=31.20 TRINITY_DN14456_c0_g1_i1:389-1171(-)
MDVDDEYLNLDNSSAKIEELPDDAFVLPSLSSRDSAYIVQSESEDNSAIHTDDSMEDVEPCYPTKTVRGNVVIEEVDDDAEPETQNAPSLDQFTENFVSMFYRTLNSFWRLGLSKNTAAMWKMKNAFMNEALFTLCGARLSGSEAVVSQLASWLITSTASAASPGFEDPQRTSILHLKAQGASSAALGSQAVHILVTGRVEAIPSQPRVADVESDEMIDESMENATGRGDFTQTFILLRAADGRWMIAQSILRVDSVFPT